MTAWQGTSWSAPQTMLTNVSWFPEGVLKGYEYRASPTLGGTAQPVNVSFRYGANNSLPTDAIPTTSCAVSPIDANGSGDSSGRLRAIYVTGASDMLRVFYRWRGEQLAEASRCYITGATPYSEVFHNTANAAFQYDKAGRMTGSQLPNVGAMGGFGDRNAFEYDVRSNRTVNWVNFEAGIAMLYEDGSNPDRLTSTVFRHWNAINPTFWTARDAAGQATVPVKVGFARNYSYDNFGRNMYISGDFGFIESFSWATDYARVAGTDSVMRAVATPAGSFNYFYDIDNRRIRKQYPNGDIDGFLWGSQKQLLAETSATGVGANTPVMDEYVWLGNLPVFSIRSTFNSVSSLSQSWTRAESDWSSNCPRRGVAGTCQPYAIIPDVQTKPVATVDVSRRISGVLEYSPTGFVNRREHWAEGGLHQASGCWWVSTFISPGFGPFVGEARLHAPRVDFNRGGSTGWLNLYRNDSFGNTTWGQQVAFGDAPNLYTPWVPMTSDNVLHLQSCSGDNDVQYNPQAWGTTLRGLEYKKYESGAVHFIPPFRFPGQYYDAETDFHENWNRFYDPYTGRYLSPEPLLQNPEWVRSELEDGHQVPAYSYARNNPVSTTDPTGLYAWRVECLGRGVAFEYTNVFSAPPLILTNLSSSGLTTASNDPCDDFERAVDLGKKYKDQPWFKAQADCWKALKKEIGGHCHGLPKRPRERVPPPGYADDPRPSGANPSRGVCGP
jgi:RHS repeat-associated protein